MLLKKVKGKSCKYLRMENLGGYWYNKDELLKEYGISIVQRQNESDELEETIIDEEKEMLLAPFRKDPKFHYEVIKTGQNEEYLLISTGDKVFKKWKNKSEVVEIQELAGFHWFQSYGTEGLLFQENRRNMYSKMLWISSGKISEIDGSIRPFEKWGHPVMNAGIEMLDGKGFKYVYLRDEKIVISEPFQKRFEGYKQDISSSIPNRFQVNKPLNNGKWKIYEVTKESGIIEWLGEGDNVEPIDEVANVYIATIKGKDTGEILELPLSTSNGKPIIYSIPGSRLTCLGSVGNIAYYEIGDRKGNLFLAKFDDNNKIKILAKYKGDALQISRSNNEDLEESIENRLQLIKILVEPAEPVETYN